MNSPKPIIFSDIIHQMKLSQVGKTTLAIWGGRCGEDELLTFLRQWDLAEMPYRIWEYASTIKFQKDTLPEHAILLQRGRLFGPGGDLEVRRNGREFTWRFIGPAGAHPPEGNYQAQNYWDSHSDAVFFEEEARALLWGQRQVGNDRWKENRVGAAQLDYPASDGWQRVQIHYKTYSCAGQIEFVWYTNLSKWKEDNNG